MRKIHPHHTAEYVSRDLDCSPSTARKWLERSSAPNVGMFGKMLDVWGAEFAEFVFPHVTWLKVALAISSRDAAAQQIADAEAVLASLRARS